MTEERTLERETRMRGLAIPAGSTTGPDDFGIVWIKLGSTARIHGHVFAAGTTLELASVLPVVLHPALLLVYPWLVAQSLRARPLARSWPAVMSFSMGRSRHPGRSSTSSTREPSRSRTRGVSPASTCSRPT